MSKFFIAQNVDMNSHNEFLVASLFSGGGGSSLGYYQAGARVLFAVEFDKKKAEIYSSNFPKTQIFNSSIEKLDPRDCLRQLDLRPGELTLLDGSPPCQGFSLAGKRIFTDPRNQLFKEFSRFLTVIQPKIFVVENVPGLIIGEMKRIFLSMLDSFHEAGYQVVPVLLNAKNYSVPQARLRVFFLGFRNDLNLIPSPPAPHQHVITVREAINQCPKGEHFPVSERVLECMYRMNEGHRFPQPFYYTFNYRLFFAKPSRTIKTCIRKEIPVHVHPIEHRFLTVEEVKRICTFPDDFYLGKNRYESITIMGNSVPPRLTQAIAESLWSQINTKNT